MFSRLDFTYAFENLGNSPQWSRRAIDFAHGIREPVATIDKQ
jgi:hypothetical protein